MIVAIEGIPVAFVEAKMAPPTVAELLAKMQFVTVKPVCVTTIPPPPPKPSKALLLMKVESVILTRSLFNNMACRLGREH